MNRRRKRGDPITVPEIMGIIFGFCLMAWIAHEFFLIVAGF